MIYEISYTEDAERHIALWRKSGQMQVLRKIAKLLEELQEHPTFGTGKPERLRGNLNGFWSREITKKDRLIYKIEDSEVIVFVISLKGHYGDK